MRLYRQPAVPTDKVPQHLADRYENEAARYWEAFYQRNSDKFFKDRHYFDKEFPKLLDGQLTVLEVGCGVGNSVFPLLGINPQLRVYACDFSATAVQIVQAHPDYNTDRVTAFVADITKDALQQHVPQHSLNYCSMVFVLSAVAPEKMPQAIHNVASVLKPGTGRVLFRDYAEGDLAQTRLECVTGSRFIRGNFYVRGDGTCCYYYTEDGLKALFAAEGFLCESHLVHARVIENRKSGVKMHRRWVQAVFRYAPEEVQNEQRQRAKQLWEAGQQQQEQQEEAVGALSVGHQQQRQQQLGSVNSGSSVRVACAGHEWMLPELLGGGSSSSSSGTCPCLQQLAAELDRLLQHQQLQWLGLHALLLPPWLTLTASMQPQQQQENQCLLVQQAPSFPQLSTHRSHDANTSSNGSNDAPYEQQQYTQYIQGAGTALVALVAVRHGAGHVFACMPGKDSLTDDARPYELGFNAVLQLNECDVVIERIRQRRWAPGDRRQLQLLQRELQQQQHIDVVMGHAPAATECSAVVKTGQGTSGGSCLEISFQAVDSQLQELGFLSSISKASKQQDHKQQVLRLLLHDSQVWSIFASHIKRG